MKLTKNLAKLFLLLIVSVVICSCSNNELSRSKAEELIKAKFKYPRPLEHKFFRTRVALSNEPRLANDLVSYQNHFDQLTAAGALTYEKNTSISRYNTVFISQLTDKGKKYMDGPIQRVSDSFEGDEFCYVIPGYVDFGEISGILERKELNTAVVYYTDIVKDITPFGKIFDIDQKPINRTATFTKYDDGWRINQ